MPAVVVIPAKALGEYFCNGCGQLRLWVDDCPTACGNCKSSELEHAHVGSPKLDALRAAWKALNEKKL